MESIIFYTMYNVNFMEIIVSVVKVKTLIELINPNFHPNHLPPVIEDAVVYREKKIVLIHSIDHNEKIDHRW